MKEEESEDKVLSLAQEISDLVETKYRPNKEDYAEVVVLMVESQQGLPSAIGVISGASPMMMLGMLDILESQIEKLRESVYKKIEEATSRRSRAEAKGIDVDKFASGGMELKLEILQDTLKLKQKLDKLHDQFAEAMEADNEELAEQIREEGTGLMDEFRNKYKDILSKDSSINETSGEDVFGSKNKPNLDISPDDLKF